MAKLKGNIWALVKGAAKDDKRSQLIPESNPKASSQTLAGKPWQPSLRSVAEPYIRVRLELPVSMKDEIDRYFFENKKKGKNEFMVEAIRKYLKTID